MPARVAARATQMLAGGLGAWSKGPREGGRLGDRDCKRDRCRVRGARPRRSRIQASTAGVVTLVDVRLNPISRRRGLSKTALRTRLEEESIVYEHLPASGNPRDNRQGFSVVTGSEARNARIRFVDRLKAEPGQEALGRASSSSPKPGPLPCCVSREMRPAATGL